MGGIIFVGGRGPGRRAGGGGRAGGPRELFLYRFVLYLQAFEQNPGRFLAETITLIESITFISSLRVPQNLFTQMDELLN